MARIRLIDIEKFFGKNHVIKNLNLDITDGEFVTLLGPSGCGKTTTLRMIAGFENPTSGEIYIDDDPVFSKEKNINVPPEERNIGMVFQNYAVWPHMNVFENIAYPLKIRKFPKDEIVKRVEEVIKIVRLQGLEKRYPYQLSGGQQQRVAFARSLVYSPRILLFDEPLSNLDAKLREEMRFEIKEIQKRLGITVVYVTHDQSEAMVMSDRIVVMKDGIVQQIGTPFEVYDHPKNKFVADFIGLSNFLEGRILGVSKNDDLFEYEVELLEVDGNPVLKASSKAEIDDKEATVVIRPEDVVVSSDGPIKASVKKATFSGSYMDYIMEIGRVSIRVITPKHVLLKEGENIRLSIKKAVIVED